MAQGWEWLGQVIESLDSGVLGDPTVWSYVLLALLVAVEGPLSTLLGAAAAAAGYLDVRWVLVTTVLGNIGGDAIWFLIGYHGLSGPLLRYGRWIGLRPHHLARLERAMQEHAVKLILLAKLAYGLIVPTLVAAGMARVPARRWFPVVVIMETAWSFVLVWLGYHATWMIADFERGMRVVGLLALAAVIILIMVAMRRRVQEAELALDPLSQVLLREEDPLPRVNGLLNGHPQPQPEPDSTGEEPAQEAVKEPERPIL